MTVRWCTLVRQQRPPEGSWHVYVVRREGDRITRIIHSVHATKAAAQIARATVRLDPAAHWREPRKRGPTPSPLRWEVSVRRALSGAWKVSLTRRTRGPEGSTKREAVVATCATEAEAEAVREHVRRTPDAHWREPREDHPQARASKQRAALRRVERERAAPVERQPEPIEGGWLLGCGVHEAARPAHPCPACAMAAAETEAALTALLTVETMAVMKRRAA